MRLGNPKLETRNKFEKEKPIPKIRAPEEDKIVRDFVVRGFLRAQKEFARLAQTFMDSSTDRHEFLAARMEGGICCVSGEADYGVSMDKPWYREMFSRSHKPDLKPNEAKVEAIGAGAGDGDAETEFHRGLLFSNSEGETPDYAQAAGCYLKAANLNHPLAQYNLGLMYAGGQGVARDEVQATMWMRKAAEQGDAGAQFNLGSRCHRSSVNSQETNVAESRIESYKWFRLAGAQGYNQADASCERISLNMTFEEVAEGNHRVAAFVPGNPGPR